MDRRSLFGIARSDSVASASPLIERLERFVTPTVIDAIAAEHRSGRRLYVGTTNLDAQNFTIWNMGAIANVGTPEAYELFRTVMLASASIPILMPPVLFDVEVDGQQFDEMHADGGVQSQFFIPLQAINLPEAIATARANGFPGTPRPRMFVIRNAKFQPEPKSVDRNLTTMARRTISSLLQSMGRSDLYQVFAVARARGNDIVYTEVPDSFIWNANQEFDGPEMRRLYAIGFEEGQKPEVWRRDLPGLFEANTARQ